LIPILLRFWKPIAGAAVILLVLFGAYRWAYGRGVEATEGHYQSLLTAAEMAKARAEERTRTIEATAQSLTLESEARHAETIAALNGRAADADRRLRALGVRLSARRNCGEVSAIPGTTAESDATAAGDERAAGAGSAIADTGRRCESDAAQLASLQQWIRSQQALMQ
jgi:hypothetical protein